MDICFFLLHAFVQPVTFHEYRVNFLHRDWSHVQEQEFTSVRPTRGPKRAQAHVGMDSDVWKFELSIFVSAKNVNIDIRIRIRF
jgi:hypothetical protein